MKSLARIFISHLPYLLCLQCCTELVDGAKIIFSSPFTDPVGKASAPKKTKSLGSLNFSSGKHIQSLPFCFYEGFHRLSQAFLLQKWHNHCIKLENRETDRKKKKDKEKKNIPIFLIPQLRSGSY